MESKKVLNTYKVVAILTAYKDCIKRHSYTSKDALSDNLIRMPIVDKVIRAKNFEDIDAIELKNLQKALERFPCKNIDECQKFLSEIYDSIPDEDYKLLKRLGLDISEKAVGKVDEDPDEDPDEDEALKEFRRIGKEIEDWDDDISDDEDDDGSQAEERKREKEREKAIKERDKRLKMALERFFINNEFYSNFLEDIELEFERREIELNKVGVKTGTSTDDSVLAAFRKREKEREAFLEKIEKEAKNCKSFNELERLLLMYTTGRGCDYMNGFLRGDMSAIKADVKPVDESEEKLKPNLKNSSWDTDLNVDLNLLLDTALNAFKLRKSLAKGKLDHVAKVYKGISLDRIKRALGLEDSYTMKKVMEYINKNKPIYKTREFTSTSTDYSMARGHACRVKNTGQSVIMNIELEKGTVFGKDLSKTSFDKYEVGSEVVLMSNQKIKLNKAKIKENLLEIECETKK